MPNALQLYLSPRPRRTRTAHLAEVKGIYHACHAWFRVEDGLNYVYEEHYCSTHAKAQGFEKSETGPPPHIHLYQTEYFTAISGVLGLECEGKQILLKPGDPELSVTPGKMHRFWAQEGGGEKDNMVVRVRVDPSPGGMDESFIRNFFSYAADCETHNLPLSPFQLFLFLWSHDMVLALPLPLPLNKALHWFISVVAVRLFGYRASYPEYYSNGPQTSKKEL
jgi:mannose-6-phosphate isomerase-like protein (cupin superfamily)